MSIKRKAASSAHADRRIRVHSKAESNDITLLVDPGNAIPAEPQWTDDEEAIILSSILNKLRKLLNMALKPTKAQLDEIKKMHYDKVLETETQQLIERLRILAGQGIQPVLAFCNIKSGSKTTVALYVGSVIAEYTRKNVLLIPATHNTATATAAQMAGIAPGKTISVSEYSRNIEQYGIYRALSQRVPRTPYGLGIISEDKHSIIDDDGEPNDDLQRQAFEKFDTVVRTTIPNVDVLLLDLGNDNIQRYNIAVSAARFSDVLNFVALSSAPISKRTMGQTMAGYNTGTKLELLEGSIPLPGEIVSLRNKVQNSNVIMSGVRPGDTVDFEELTRPDEQSVYAQDLPKWNGDGLQVPFDPYIAQEDVSICDLHKITPETLLAFLKIAVAGYEKSARPLNTDATHGVTPASDGQSTQVPATDSTFDGVELTQDDWPPQVFKSPLQTDVARHSQ